MDSSGDPDAHRRLRATRARAWQDFRGVTVPATRPSTSEAPVPDCFITQSPLDFDIKHAFDYALNGDTGRLRQCFEAGLHTSIAYYSYSFTLAGVKKEKARLLDDSSNLLHAAVLSKCLATVQLCLSLGINYLHRNAKAVNCIQLAIHRSSPEIVRYLFENCKTDYAAFRDDQKRTYLHDAAKRGNILILDLVSTLCPVDERDEDGWTALSCALTHDDSSLAALLIQNFRASLHLTDREGNNSLHWAAYYGSLKSVESVVETEKNRGKVSIKRIVNCVNGLGDSALHIATRNQWTDVVRKLLDYGANPHVRNNAGENCPEIARKVNFAMFFDSIPDSATRECVEKSTLRAKPAQTPPNVYFTEKARVTLKRRYPFNIPVGRSVRGSCLSDASASKLVPSKLDQLSIDSFDTRNCESKLIRGDTVESEGTRDESASVKCSDIASSVKEDNTSMKGSTADGSGSHSSDLQQRTLFYAFLWPSQVIASDISHGRERYPIPCVSNETERCPKLAPFVYLTRNVFCSEYTQDLLHTCFRNHVCSKPNDGSNDAQTYTEDKSEDRSGDNNSQALLNAETLHKIERKDLPRENVPLRLVWDSNMKRWTVITEMDVPKGAFVTEYIGQFVKSAKQRRCRMSSFFLVDRCGLAICAQKYGNVARFLRVRTKQFNLKAVIVLTNPNESCYVHICLHAQESLVAGTELVLEAIPKGTCRKGGHQKKKIARFDL